MAFAFRRCAVQATLSLLLVVVCLSSGLLTAEEFSGTIGAPGQATAKIPADVLTIAFLFETQSTSFAEAKSEAEEMQHRLQAVHIPIESVLLSTEYDYDTLKQRGFYWKKGSKVEHRITLTINGLPAESLHDTLAAVIDQTVDLSPKLTITDASSEVSESHLKAARTELLAEAVRDARANAEVIAKESGLVIRATRAVYATPTPRGPLSPIDGVSEAVVLGYNLRESFVIRGGLSQNTKVSVFVAAEYSTTEP